MSRRIFFTVLFSVSLLVLTGVTRAPAAQAANIVVNSLADIITDSNGQCTLREAIKNANGDVDKSGGDCVPGSGNDTITFSVSGTITLGSALPGLKTNLTIQAHSDITLDGAFQYPIFRVNGDGNTVNLLALNLVNGNCNPQRGGGGAISNANTLIVTGSTFQNNNAALCQGGGAINNGGGTLTVSNSLFENNSAESGGNVAPFGGGAILNTGNVTINGNTTFTSNSAQPGGAIANINGGTMSVQDTLFNNNTGDNYGGAIYNNASTLSVSGSSFEGNDTDVSGYGGGIANLQGTLNVTTSTLSQNWAKRGGSIYNDSGALNLLASTLVDNRGWGSGGAVYNTSGNVLVTNSTLTGNSTGGEYGGGFYTENGSLYLVNSTMALNSCECGDFGAAGIYGDGTAITVSNTILAEDDTTCDVNADEFSVQGTNYAVDGSCPQVTETNIFFLFLGNLANNGGPTQTIKPGPGSIAREKGDNTICTAAVGAPTYGAGGIDQRGVTRPQRQICDVGAYEVR